MICKFRNYAIHFKKLIFNILNKDQTRAIYIEIKHSISNTGMALVYGKQSLLSYLFKDIPYTLKVLFYFVLFIGPIQE